MKNIISLVVLATLASCNPQAPTTATGASTPTVGASSTPSTLSAFNMNFISGNTTDFNAYASSWTRTNNNVTEAETQVLNLTGAANSDVTYQYRGQFTDTFNVEVDIGFKGENKIGNQFDITMDFGNGNKMIGTVISSAANYVSPIDASNTLTRQAYVKVYSNNILVDSSAVDTSIVDPSSWDPTQGYVADAHLYRSTSQNQRLELYINITGIGSITHNVSESQAATWGLTGNATYSIKFSAGNTNSMVFTVDAIIQQQASGFIQ